MKKNRRVYFILGSIPVLFVLFLLAMVNVLYMLLAVVAILAVALLLKKKKPEWFAGFGRKKVEKSPEYQPISVQSSKHEPPQVVYLVLAAQNQNSMQRIPIDKVRFSIGREKDNDYVIKDDHISRHHLRIEYDERTKTASAIDLNSTHHSYLNGDMLQPDRSYTLAQGDQLMIYDYVFMIDMANYG